MDEATGDKQKLKTDQIRLQVLKQDYTRFSEKADLPMQYERMEVAGFTWKHGKAAESTAKSARQAEKEAARKNVELEKQQELEYNKKIEETRKHIRSDVVPKKLNQGNQQKHIKDSPGYISGKSYIYGDLVTAQTLVDTFHGSGVPVFKRSGEWNNKEIIISDSVMGVNIDPVTGTETETRRFVIHYGKKGTHVVPTKEEKYESEQTV